MTRPVITTTLILFLLSMLPTATADHPGDLPSGANCPFGYNETAFLNVCTLPTPEMSEREVCIIGNVCESHPVPLNANGKPPAVIYLDAFCNLTLDRCECGFLAEGLIYSCTPMQQGCGTSCFPPGPPPQDAGFRANCSPLAYTRDAFVNVCVLETPGWGTGITAFNDYFCVGLTVCAFGPGVAEPSNGGGASVFVAIYVEIACNLPNDPCTCAYYLANVLIVCSPFQE